MIAIWGRCSAEQFAGVGWLHLFSLTQLDCLFKMGVNQRRGLVWIWIPWVWLMWWAEHDAGGD